MDVATINKIINKVFPQISTSFDMSDILGLATGVTQYKLGDNTGFPFEKTDGIMYSNCGDCVVALGLAENVEELHKFLYPDEESTGVSDTVQGISDNITELTGVIRPVDLEQNDNTTDEGTTSESVTSTQEANAPVITSDNNE